jgi:hypothetical protein
MSYAIIINTNYKMKNLPGIYRHNERKNTNYSNKDIDKTKSKENYSIKSPSTTYTKLFKQIKELYNLKGQIKSVSNVACEYIITSDKDFFDNIGKEETKRFFKSAYSFVCNYKNLGEQYILSAKVHMDEKTPHMHLVFIPVIHTKDKNGNDIDKISCSEFWKGRDSYKYLQNNFHKYINTCGFKLDRGANNNNKHLSMEQLKSLTNYDKIKEEINKTPIKETTSNSLDLVVTENKKLVKHCNRLREYCITSVNTFNKCLEYETEIKNLKEENSFLKEKIKNLKNYIEKTFEVVKHLFHFPINSFKNIVENLIKHENKDKYI